MRDYAKLPRETFDIRWVDSRRRVSVAAPTGGTAVPTPITSSTIGTTWELNLKRFRNFAPHLDVEALQTFLSDA